MSVQHDAKWLRQILAALGGAGTYTDKSDTISTGGASQELAASNSSRINILVQNPTSEIESLFVNFGAAATGGGDSVELTPGGLQVFNTTQQITVIAATTGHAFVAKELA